ncbi:MAG: hypothetical protein N2V76_07150 [Methanophagales archaeon]|nr:hypothetical protein [Methanophagales archaeon]
MLFEEGWIGTRTTKNRIVFPPISTSLASPSGEIIERFIYQSIILVQCHPHSMHCELVSVIKR